MNAMPCFGLDFASVAEVRVRIMRARNAGCVVTEVPIRHRERTKGQTCHHFGKLFGLFLNVHRYFRALHHELWAGRAARRAMTLPFKARRQDDPGHRRAA